MIKSMTGYGRAEKTFDEYKIIVEVKSVNNRYLDSNIKLYKNYLFLEDMIRTCLTEKLARGKVDVFVQIESTGEEEIVVNLNENTALGYYKAAQKLLGLIDVKNDISASTFLRIPDVFVVEKQEKDIEKITSDAKCVVAEAVDDLIVARRREGERLYNFFMDCIATVRSIAEFIKEKSPETVIEYEKKIRQRIEELLENIEIDQNRLLTEVGIFADKVNITEELIRFDSHLNEFASLLQSDAPVGRKLDFIIQELNREANTMGSKCNDFVVSKSVVELKSEIEKLREQVQNIE